MIVSPQASHAPFARFYSGAVPIAALCWLISACSTPAETDERPALTLEQMLDPANCKDCHPKHYEQWSASMHAYASKDPVFLAMNKRGQESTNGTLGEFCVNCHAPMAVRLNKITNFADLSDVPEHLQGVTCYFCHNAIGVGSDHFNANITLANDTTMRAALRNAVEPSTHKVAYSAFHDPASDKSSLMCGTCHDIRLPNNNFPLERTFQEYTASIVSPVGTTAFQSCQDCHMKTAQQKQPAADSTGRPDQSVPARNLHEHLWPAVDVALTPFPHHEAMLSAIQGCALESALSSFFTVERAPGPLGLLKVTLEAQTGHSFPSGATQDRRLWVEMIAYDEKGSELFRSGVIGDGQVEETHDEPHPCMFRDYLLDANGQETHMFWEAASLDETRSRLLPATALGGSTAAGAHSRDCTFRPPIAVASIPPTKIDLRVRLRPMGIDVLQDLVNSKHLAPEFIAKMPTHTVQSYTANYNAATNTYSVINTSVGDCDTYRCMLDPDSIVCNP